MDALRSPTVTATVTHMPCAKLHISIYPCAKVHMSLKTKPCPSWQMQPLEDEHRVRLRALKKSSYMCARHAAVSGLLSGAKRVSGARRSLVEKGGGGTLE